MRIAPQLIFGPLALLYSIEAAGTAIPDSGERPKTVPQIAHNSTDSDSAGFDDSCELLDPADLGDDIYDEILQEDIPELCIEDLAISQPATETAPLVNANMDISILFERGEHLKKVSQDQDIEDIVNLLDREISGIAEAPCAAAILSCFSEILDELFEMALEVKALNLLRIFQVFNVFNSTEQFHQFIILSYKSDWYNEELWKTHKMDWSMVPLDWILKSNNLSFLEDFLSCKLPFTNHHNIDKDQLFNLIAENDFLDVYKSLGFTAHGKLVSCMRTLAEFGSVKLLRLLIESKSLDNLHLESYPFPKKLPKSTRDFEFLMEQGYRYLPPVQLLKKAYEGGHLNILEYLRNFNPKVFTPSSEYLELAAGKGHLNLLKWIKGMGISINSEKILASLIQSENFEAINWLLSVYRGCFVPAMFSEGACGLDTLIGTQIIKRAADIAARSNKLRAVKFLYERFKILPESTHLRVTSTRILKWVQKISPDEIKKALKTRLGLDNLKWLWKNHQDLFTEEVKQTQTSLIDCGGKLRWIFQNWKKVPSVISWNISVEDLKEFEWAISTGKMVIHEIVARRFAVDGNLESLKWLFEHRRSSIGLFVIEEAVRGGHLEIADFFHPHLEHKQNSYLAMDLTLACKTGNLELLKWVHKKYDILPSAAERLRIVSYGRLEVVKWIFSDIQCIYRNELKSLQIEAIVNWHIEVFLYLNERFPKIMSLEESLKHCFLSGNLRFFKNLVRKDININFKTLLERSISDDNYHLWQWLIDLKLW